MVQKNYLLIQTVELYNSTCIKRVNIHSASNRRLGTQFWIAFTISNKTASLVQWEDFRIMQLLCFAVAHYIALLTLLKCRTLQKRNWSIGTEDLLAKLTYFLNFTPSLQARWTSLQYYNKCNQSVETHCFR